MSSVVVVSSETRCGQRYESYINWSYKEVRFQAQCVCQQSVCPSQNIPYHNGQNSDLHFCWVVNDPTKWGWQLPNRRKGLSSRNARKMTLCLIDKSRLIISSCYFQFPQTICAATCNLSIVSYPRVVKMRTALHRKRELSNLVTSSYVYSL